MNRIIIMSDTHGNQQMLRRVLSNENYTHIFHLGDNYNDLDDNFDLTESKDLLRVPGLYHQGYNDKSLPAIQTYSLDGWNFNLIHDIGSLKKLKKNSIYLHGHTHNVEFFEKDKNVFTINPGHLKSQIDRGQRPSYIVAEVDENSVKFDFKELSGKIIGTKIINKNINIE